MPEVGDLNEQGQVWWAGEWHAAAPPPLLRWRVRVKVIETFVYSIAARDEAEAARRIQAGWGTPSLEDRNEALQSIEPIGESAGEKR